MFKETWPGMVLAAVCIVVGGVYLFRHEAGFDVEIIRAEEETASSAFSVEKGMTGPEEDPAPPVNINTAGAEELQRLTGIGPAKAAAILTDRAANGLYLQPEALMRVPGIKEGTFGKLKDRVTVGNAREAAALRKELEQVRRTGFPLSFPAAEPAAGNIREPLLLLPETLPWAG